MARDYVPLDNKEIHKRASQIRFKRKTERLVFCWWCVSFHDKIHFCEVQAKWRHIDLGNFLVITGPSRESVERYRNNFAVENDITCTLYDSRVRLNKGERVAGKQFHEKKEKEAQEKKDKADAETWWVKNSEKIVRMDVGKCYEYLKQSGERQVVYGMLYERLRQFKGPPPQPPQKQPMKPLHPPQQPCHRTPCTCSPCATCAMEWCVWPGMIEKLSLVEEL